MGEPVGRLLGRLENEVLDGPTCELMDGLLGEPESLRAGLAHRARSGLK